MTNIRTEKKKSKVKGLMAAFLATMLAVSLLVMEKPAVYMTAADVTQKDNDTNNIDFSVRALCTLTNGVLVAAVSDGVLLTAYDEDAEQIPDVDKEAAVNAIGVWLADGRLTATAAAVQTSARCVNDDGNGVYTVTLPAAVLLITKGIVDVDKLAVFAVQKAPDGKGAEISAVSYMVSANPAHDGELNVTLTLPHEVTLLLIDTDEDGELDRSANKNGEPVSRNENQEETPSEKTSAPVRSTEDKSKEKPQPIEESTDEEITYTLESETVPERQADESSDGIKSVTAVNELPSDRDDEAFSLTEEANESPVTGGRDF